MSLTRDQLLAPAPRTTQFVDAPELGGSVFVRALSVRELLDLEQAITANEDIATRMAVQISSFLGTEDGGSLLTLDDAKLLVDKPGAKDAIRRIISAGLALNGYGDIKGN
jgi:hypothetical protein